MTDVAANNTEITPLVERLATTLLASQTWLATAESCTGGGIAYQLTEISGSSQWFDRAFVTYSNEAKQEMLGVSATTLQKHGAVSDVTVKEMAMGAIMHSRAGLSVAVSGIAGPTGGSADKPVGLVWFSWARRDAGEKQQHIISREESRLFSGNRHEVRLQTIVYALQGLLVTLDA